MEKFLSQDERFMALALRLARRGTGWVSPNPMVGAVIVDGEGRILAKGCHRRFGDLHAEREALKKLNWKAPGTTMYVTLEPCCHYGKTLPCTEAIIQAGTKRIVVGTLDPNPLVAGKGVKILEEAGIRVDVGVLEEACRDLNRAFFKWVTTGLPWVLLKWAQSIDGTMATASGHSRWISGPEALKYAHRLRAVSDAVLVGRETATMDNPQLTVRLIKGKNPLRVVLDTHLTLPLDRRLFTTPPPTLIFTLEQDLEKTEILKRKGVEVVVLESNTGEIPLKSVLEELSRRQVAQLLVEGGGGVITSFLKQGLADEIHAIAASILLGQGRPPVGNLSLERVDQAIKLEKVTHKRLGRDLLVMGRVVKGTRKA
jgi:diaminohydroxyphosphoribosylaminopyrimidine deaminase/5-amino-6-(5-phosphoribosylamino)uracil reductase